MATQGHTHQTSPRQLPLACVNMSTIVGLVRFATCTPPSTNVHRRAQPQPRPTSTYLYKLRLLLHIGMNSDTSFAEFIQTRGLVSTELPRQAMHAIKREMFHGCRKCRKHSRESHGDLLIFGPMRSPGSCDECIGEGEKLRRCKSCMFVYYCVSPSPASNWPIFRS